MYRRTQEELCPIYTMFSRTILPLVFFLMAMLVLVFVLMSTPMLPLIVHDSNETSDCVHLFNAGEDAVTNVGQILSIS